MSKIYLGVLKENVGTFADGEAIYLSKHEWSCGWYWAFGYVGNAKCRFHFDSLLYLKDGNGSVRYEASQLFSECNISDKDWWVIRELFVQAYALKKAAEVYRCGGRQITKEGVTDLIRDDEMVFRLNADLKRVLDKIWDGIAKATGEQALEAIRAMASQPARQPLTDAQVVIACSGFRRDFGRLTYGEQEHLCFQAREWDRAISKARGEA